ncbi:MAG: hypothetical protein ABH835_04255 [Patescibacteria group bacterium]
MPKDSGTKRYSEPEALRSISHYAEWGAAVVVLGLQDEVEGISVVPERFRASYDDAAPYDGVLNELILYLLGVERDGTFDNYIWLSEFPFLTREIFLEAIKNLRGQGHTVSEEDEKHLCGILPGEEKKEENAKLISRELWSKLLEYLREEFKAGQEIDEIMGN